jgi:N-acetylglucosamine kinase-like BadF-type ATPase
LQYFGVESVEEVLHLYHYRLRPAPVSVDHLTPMLLDEAQAGDQVAARVVREHGAALGDFAIAAARHVGIEDLSYPLVLAGGVFRHPTMLLEEAIALQVGKVSPEVRPVRSPHEPIVGVLLEALVTAGVEIDGALWGRLLASLPASELIGAPALHP